LSDERGDGEVSALVASGLALGMRRARSGLPAGRPSASEARSSPAHRATPTRAIDVPERPGENSSTTVNSRPGRSPANQFDDRPSGVRGRLQHIMNPKRKNGVRLNTRRLGVERLEDRRLLAIMQSFDLDPLHQAEALKPEYTPVGWLGGLNEDGTVHHGASAVLIANAAGSVEWALTAAHVVEYNLNQPGFVQMQFGLGPDFFNNPGETRMVDAWYLHPDWSAAAENGTTPDLALVHLAEPFDVDPAVLYAGTLDYGDPITMVGYGAPGTDATGQMEFDGIERAGTNVVQAFGGDGTPGYSWYAPFMVFSDFNDIDPTPLEWLLSSGDSGGGLFISHDGQTYLSAINVIASGPFAPGFMQLCSTGSVQTAPFQDWIDSTINTAEPLDVTVATAAVQAPLTNTGPVLFTATFSSAVTDFDASDVVASGAPGTLVPTVTPVGTGGTTYTIAVSGMTGDGQVVVSIPADAAHNAGGNGNSASTALDSGVTYDVTAPGGSIVDVLTNDATPLLGGAASDANGVSGVSVTVGAQTFAGVLHTADGIWSAEVPASLLDGVHTATVTVTDNAGNTSTDTATVTVDTVAPVVGVNSLTTTITAPTLTGPITDASPSSGITGVTVVVGGQTLAATVSGNTWSAVVSAPLAVGTYNVTATAADAAGNTAADGTANELVVDTHPWHNSADPCNVDGRSGVEPVDVLLVINYINAHGSGPLPAPGPNTPPPYVDVNADNEVAPVDVLLVINWINSQTAGGAGEAEPWSDGAAAFLATPTLWPASDRATWATAGLLNHGEQAVEGIGGVRSPAPSAVGHSLAAGESDAGFSCRDWDEAISGEWSRASVLLDAILNDIVPGQGGRLPSRAWDSGQTPCA